MNVLKKQVESVIVALLGLMLSITVLQQTPGPIYARLRTCDPCALIPMWSFFAPRPATRDYESLNRLVYSDGSVSDWRQSTAPQRRTLISDFWAPKRRVTKSLFDMTSDLLPLLRERNSAVIEMSPVYQSLALYHLRLARCDATEDVIGVQFSIVLHAGHDITESPQVLFASKAHYLEGMR